MTNENSKTPSRRKRAYELEGMTPLSLPQDPIGAFENQALQDLSDEYRMLKLEQMIAKRRRDVEKMRNGVVDDGSLPSNTDFLNMAKFIAELSPEEAARVRNAYSFLKLSEKGGGSGMNMLPMMLNYARQNPNASEGQMVQYLTLMNSQFSKGLEVAKATNPTQDGSLELLKVFTDVLKTSFMKPIEELARNIQPQQGVLEQMLTNPQLRSTMKEIGMFGGGSAVTTNIDLEIERLRGERHLQATKWELEMRRDELKRMADDRRTENLLAVFGPLITAFGGPTAQRMREFGQQQASTHNPMQPNVFPQMDAVQLMCSCGYQGTEQLTNPPQNEIACPGCGKMLMVHTHEPSSMEERKNE